MDGYNNGKLESRKDGSDTKVKYEVGHVWSKSWCS